MNDMEEMSEYEKKCEQYRSDNQHYLEVFLCDLIKENLSIHTINKHTSKIDNYLNHYLLSANNAYSMQEGISMVQGFINSQYISVKPASIKTAITNIKKFYKIMMDNGEIGKDDYDYLMEDIKNNLDDWMKQCDESNDPDNRL